MNVNDEHIINIPLCYITPFIVFIDEAVINCMFLFDNQIYMRVLCNDIDVLTSTPDINNNTILSELHIRLLLVMSQD